jgi:hypothetical protein
MGCDIHMIGECKLKGIWRAVFDPGNGPFEDRSYRLFGFLANVRNYSGVTPISEPRGLPEDISDTSSEYFARWGCDIHSCSWLMVKELLEFDYEQFTEDRRVTRQVGNCMDGGCTCKPGEGKKMTYREFLGEWYFKHLGQLQEEGVERIVFGFDN